MQNGGRLLHLDLIKPKVCETCNRLGVNLWEQLDMTALDSTMNVERSFTKSSEAPTYERENIV